MSSEQSTTNKVLIGCLIAGVVGMLLCGGVIALVGFWGVGMARQVAQEIGPQLQEQGERMHFADSWQPPAADVGAEQLFPEAIGAWTLSGHDDAAAIPELAIDRDGWHGTYESAGSTINVYVYQVPLAEKTQMFDAAAAAIDGAGYSTQSKQSTDFGSVHWMTFSFSPPERHGRMWWTKDWLIVATTENAAVNLEGFEEDYLTAIQAPEVLGADDSPSAEPVVPADETPVQPEAPAETAPDSPDATSTETAPAEPATSDTAPDNPDAN